MSLRNDLSPHVAAVRGEREVILGMQRTLHVGSVPREMIVTAGPDVRGISPWFRPLTPPYFGLGSSSCYRTIPRQPYHRHRC
jgi:hypothetical protein